LNVFVISVEFSMPAVASRTRLLTAEDYGALPDLGYPSELVRGRIVRMNIPKPLHGLVCSNITIVVGSFVKKHQLGWVFSNDSGVITERDPDSVRGPDVAYCSYKRLPKRSRPKRDYLDVAPELAFEVLSPDDRWSKLQSKVIEYLDAGVLVVCVVDPKEEFVLVYTQDAAPRQLGRDDVLKFPNTLPGFSVKVREFFE
jgi:Uma2 family endonuclease